MLALVLVISAGVGCATIAAPTPRFVAVFEQRTAFCRIQVIEDTRTTACFLTFRCGRQPVVVLVADERVCVP